jgi:cobalt-zinc-cadmium efflux system membrane fusion protein
MQNKKRFIQYLLGLMSIVFIIACNSNGNSSTEEEEVSTEFVLLTEAQMEVIGLELTKMKVRDLKITIPVTGELTLFAQDKADVSPIRGGVVKSIKVIEGDKVKIGQVLATMEHPDFIQLQQDYINKLNTFQYLEKDYLRQNELHNKAVGSVKEFEKAKSIYLSAKSDVTALNIKLEMLNINAKKVQQGTIFQGINIVAPISGMVSLIETNVGAYIAPKEKVFEIVNNNKLHADVVIYQKDFNKVKLGQQLLFSVSGNHNKMFEAKIFSINPNMDKNINGTHIHAEIINNDSFLSSGMYVKANIIVKNIETLALPIDAVVSNDGLSYIFVKTKDQENEEGEEESDKDSEEKWMFRKTEVVLGEISEDYVQVKLLNNIPKDAQIVSYGAYYLLAEMGKGEVEDDD